MTQLDELEERLRKIEERHFLRGSYDPEDPGATLGCCDSCGSLAWPCDANRLAMAVRAILKLTAGWSEDTWIEDAILQALKA